MFEWGKLVKCNKMGAEREVDLLGVCKWTEDLCIWNKCPKGVDCPRPWACIHVYDHNIQTSLNMWSIVRKGK